jgi:hypothetical protein
MLHSSSSDPRAKGKQLKIDRMTTRSRLAHQNKQNAEEVASMHAVLGEFKLQMATRELDFQKEILSQRTALIKYQRALQDVAQLLVNTLAQQPPQTDLSRACLDDFLAVKKRIEGKELDAAIGQLKGACVFALEEPLSYFSPSSSGKDLLRTAQFEGQEARVD